MLVSMLCWGSWANTEKIDKQWRFELFYWNYIWGLLAFALVFGLTLGNTKPASPDSLFRNLHTASWHTFGDATPERVVIHGRFAGVIHPLGSRSADERRRDCHEYVHNYCGRQCPTPASIEFAP